MPIGKVFKLYKYSVFAPGFVLRYANPIATMPETDNFRQEEERVEERSAVFKKELGLTDLVLTQIVFVVGTIWVGTAAKLGDYQLFFWLLAIATFYLPLAAVVIHLNRAMPLEGGLYQWAKLGFNEFTGFLVAWNLWLFAILNTSETGLQVTQYFRYVLSEQRAAWTSDAGVVVLANVLILSALVAVTIAGLNIGKWVHKGGGILMLVTFAMLLALPWLNVGKGTLAAYHPLA